MRILLVTPMPPDRSAPGAIPAVLHAQVRGLAARNEIVLATVAGPDPAELEALERLPAEGVEVHAIRRTEPHGRARWARRRRLAGGWLRGRWPWRTVWFWAPELQHVLDRILADRSIAVVGVEDSSMGIYRLPARVPRVFTEHEVRRPDRRPGGPDGLRDAPMWLARREDWRRWRDYQLAIWRDFHVIQTFTEPDAQAIRERLPSSPPEVVVNPFGIDMPPPVAAPEDPDRVVFIGNYTHPPNVDAARWLGLEVMPELRRLHPGVELALAGIHPPAGVRELEGDGLRVLGPVADADDLMRRAAVVLAPVRIGGGMRMKVLHAMSLGRAVVTTRLGTEGLVSEGRVPPLAVADDAMGVARAAAVLLGDPAARRRLGEAARAFVELHHTPDAYAARLEQTYRLAIETASPRSPLGRR